MINLDIRKLQDLKKQMDGWTYPTSEQIEEYLTIADDTGHTDCNIVNEQYVLDGLVKEGSVYAIKCRLEDVNNAYFNDFYQIQGDGNYTDVTISSLNDKIDDLILTIKEDEKDE